MFFRPVAIFMALLTGCQIESNASPAGDGEGERGSINKRKAEPLAVPPEDPCLDAPSANPQKCSESDDNIERFTGKWKITRVHVNPEGVQAFTENDKAIVGSVFSITTTDIKWMVKASAGFTADDICKQPSAATLPDTIAKEEGAALVQALKPFGVSPSSRGPLHRFGCAGGGNWGPGTSGGLFIPVGNVQMILKWYDGATLLAVRSDP